MQIFVQSLLKKNFFECLELRNVTNRFTFIQFYSHFPTLDNLFSPKFAAAMNVFPNKSSGSTC